MPCESYCECGCGQQTEIAPRTITRRGHVKGQPFRFIRGHNSLKSPRGPRDIALCSVCKQALPRTSFYADPARSTGLSARCKDCTRLTTRQWRRDNREASRAYRKQWRARHPGYDQDKVRDPEKESARSSLRNAVAQGRIVKPTTCEGCGGECPLIQGHHEDYSQPLEVVWLCPQCHADHHHPFSR